MTRGMGVVAVALLAGAAPAWGQARPPKPGEKGASEMHQHMHEGARELQQMKPSGDPDRDFAMMMREHHEHGIQMAKDLLAHGKDRKTRELAQRIMDEQQRDLKELDAWLESHRSAESAEGSKDSGH